MTEGNDRIEVLDFASAIALGGSGAILSRESQDLDVNLVRFERGAGVAAHTNPEVDVLVVAIAGEGLIEIGAQSIRLSSGQAVLVPRQTQRSIRSLGDGEFVYLTVHRRRARLMPTRRQS